MKRFSDNSPKTFWRDFLTRLELTALRLPWITPTFLCQLTTGSVNFRIKCLGHFLPSNGNFKTRDFSPLIKRVLAGVILSSQIITSNHNINLRNFFCNFLVFYKSSMANSYYDVYTWICQCLCLFFDWPNLIQKFEIFRRIRNLLWLKFFY